jgi:hypothetical protein
MTSDATARTRKEHSSAGRVVERHARVCPESRRHGARDGTCRPRRGIHALRTGRWSEPAATRLAGRSACGVPLAPVQRFGVRNRRARARSASRHRDQADGVRVRVACRLAARWQGHCRLRETPGCVRYLAWKRLFAGPFRPNGYLCAQNKLSPMCPEWLDIRSLSPTGLNSFFGDDGGRVRNSPPTPCEFLSRAVERPA